MNIPDIVIKIAGVIASAFAVFKIILEFPITNRSQLREEYKFCKEFIEDLEAKDDIHPLLVEKACEAIGGKMYAGVSEIRFLLNFPQPSLALRSYGQAKRYLMFDEDESQIRFKPPYRNAHDRKQIKRRYSLLYFLFSSIAFTMLYFANEILKNFDFSGQIAILLVAICFGWLAYDNLKNNLHLSEAQRLVDSESNTLKALKTAEPVNLTDSMKSYPKFGSARGLVKMSEDFNEPLDDFEAYAP
jgi:hypothetical protein